MFDNKTFNTLIFSAAVVTFGYFISNGLIFFNSGHNKSVNVKGLGERTIKADQAFWSISFESEGNTFEEARKKFHQDSESLRQFLKEQGFTENDFSFSPPVPSTKKESFYDDKRHKDITTKTTHVISSKVTVQSTNVEKIASASKNTTALLDKGIIIAGKNDHNYNVRQEANPRYILTAFDKYRPELLAEAVQSARNMASKLAQDAGAKVGSIINADQGNFSIQNPISSNDPEEASITKKIRVVSHLTYELL
ncbi:MAG: hypothetical protein CMM87_04535 [Rickettsiales bacterium]|nr:hypothetical protein [Rickettsiales bacterium]|tara:strand:+ start:8189 stop:8944 length:756 start_codon:yes stop_codon:yes gene_type:complete